MHNHPLEQAVLRALYEASCVSVERAKLLWEKAQLDEAAFHLPAHAAVWGMGSELLAEGQGFDPLTVEARYQGTEALARAGGAHAVARLLTGQDFFVEGSFPSWCETLRELALRRLALQALRVGQERLADLSVPLSDTVGTVKAGLDGFRLHKGSIRTAKEYLTAVVEHVEDVSAGRKRPVVTTGFEALNNMIGGWQPTLILVAALPGVGKNAFTAGSLQALAKSGLRAGCVSLEDPGEWLPWRLVSGEGRLSQAKMRFRRLDEVDLQSFEKGILRTAEYGDKLHIYDGSEEEHTADEVCSVLSDMFDRLGCDVAVVDNLTEVAMRNGEDERARSYAMTRYLTAFRRVANRYKRPVIVLTHLRRKEGMDEGVVPKLTDIADTSGAEKKARTVLFLTRKYDEDVLWIHCGKNNNGPGRGKKVALPFDGLAAMVRETEHLDGLDD